MKKKIAGRLVAIVLSALLLIPTNIVSGLAVSAATAIPGNPFSAQDSERKSSFAHAGAQNTDTVIPKTKSAANQFKTQSLNEDANPLSALGSSKNPFSKENKTERALKTEAEGAAQYNVKFKNTVTINDIYACVSKYTYKLLGNSENRLFRVEIGDLQDFEKTYAELVESIAQDAIMKTAAATNDIYYPHQWALSDIKLSQAWDITKGTSAIKVAVIDSGFDREHEDFNSTQILNGCDVTDGNIPVSMDLDGHGTEVISVIAAAANNSIGIAGAGWNVSVVPFKVEDDSGHIYNSSVISAITIAADLGCDVINISMGAYEYDGALQSAIDYASGKGCIVVASAGNEGSFGNDKAGHLGYPAAYNNVISVASVNQNNVRSGFSQYNSAVDVAAPGEGILVAQAGSQSYYTLGDGTSFSAPYVTAVAALARSVNKSITGVDFQQLIQQTSTDLGEPSRDDYYGWGLINAQALVKVAKNPIITGISENGVYNTPKTITFNRGTATLNGNGFTSGSTVSTNGTYTLLVTDSSGNSTTMHFTINNVPPAVTGVANSQFYNSDRVIRFNTGKATLNGNPFASGDTVSDEGSYTLIVTDSAGNKTTISFTIDKMPPVISNVIDGQNYHSAVNVTFNEGTATLNGASVSNYTIVNTEGSYTLVVTDNASNSTTVNFKISDLPTTVSMPMSSQLSQWVMDSGSGYVCAISATDNKLYFINPSTMCVDSTLTLENTPTDILNDNGTLYIALDKANKIQTVNIATKSLGAAIKTATDPNRIAKDGSTLYYAQYDQWCEIHKYDLNTNIDTRILISQETNGRFYKPDIEINPTLHILYIGESGNSGSNLYYYNLTTDSLTKCNYSNNAGFYFPDKNVQYDGQNVWYAGRKFQADDPNQYSGVFGDSRGSLLYRVNGCVISGGTICIEKTNQKIGVIASNIPFALPMGTNTVFYYDQSNNCINKTTCSSTIGPDTITGLFSGTSMCETQPGSSVQINATTTKRQFSGSIIKCISDDANKLLYAIVSNSRKVYMINQNTLNVDSIIDLPGCPTDIVQKGNELYVAIDSRNEIEVVNLNTKEVVKQIKTPVDPYQIVTDGNNLYYTEYDQWCELHKIDLTTGVDTRIGGSYKEFYSPSLAVNTTTHVLYIGEAGLSGSYLYYYDEIHDVLTMNNNPGGYGFPSRSIFFDGSYVLYASMAFDPIDPNKVIGLFNNAYDIQLASNGVVVEGDSNGNTNLYDEDTFCQIGTISKDVTLLFTSSSDKLFIISGSTVTSVQSLSGTINTGNINALASATPVAAPFKPIAGQKIDVDTVGFQINTQIERWVQDDDSHMLYAISKSGKALLFIDSDTMDLKNVLYFKNAPGNIICDSGKLYVTFFDSSQIAVIDSQTQLVVNTFQTSTRPSYIAKDGNKIFYSSWSYGANYNRNIYEYDLESGMTTAILNNIWNPTLAVNTDAHILYIGADDSLQYYSISQHSLIASKSISGSYHGLVLYDGQSVYFDGKEYRSDTPTQIGSYGQTVTFAKYGVVFTGSTYYARGQYGIQYSLPLLASFVELDKTGNLFIYSNVYKIAEKIENGLSTSACGIGNGAIYSDSVKLSFSGGSAYIDNQPISSGTVITQRGIHQLLYFDSNDKCTEIYFMVITGVQNVTLNKSSLTLDINGKETLVATISPADADDQLVNWTSSNENVATVDENGRVRGIGAGNAVITVTTDDGKKTAICTVHVTSTVLPTVKVQSISLNKNRCLLDVNEDEVLTATINPTNADNTNVNWTSSNPNVAYVLPNGDVLGISRGTAIITATTEDGNKTATCTVFVITRHVTAVSLSPTQLNMVVGYSQTLMSTVTPYNADDTMLIWSSSDNNVATVDQNGRVTPKKTGASVITATSEDGGYQASCNVNVSNLGVSYQGHVQNVGWQSPAQDGALCGTSGQSLRVEALKINLDNAPAGMHIEYTAHVQNIGWQSWVDDGAMIGTSGQSFRIEALQIKLVGTGSENYSVEYQAHVQDIGWQDWVYDGATAGTTGQSKRVEALRIKIVPKIPSVTYQGHVQEIGWQNAVSQGGISGTEGQGLRVEALKVNLINAPAGLNIKYRAHVQNIGWQYWASNGEVAGTTGLGYRVEAIQVQLEGTDADKYSVVYQVHVQNIGWQNWVSDGAIAGTTGQSLRIEAIRIMIVPKN